MSYEIHGKGKLAIKPADYSKVFSTLQDEFPDKLDGFKLANPENVTASELRDVFKSFGFNVSFDESEEIHNITYPWRASRVLDSFLSAIEDLVQADTLW